MAKNDKKKDKGGEEVIDLASRIGGRLPDAPAPPSPPAPPPPDVRPTRLDGPLPPRRTEQRDRPVLIGGDEPPPPPLPSAAERSGEALKPASGAIQSPRTPPGPNETDVVITPIPTLDDWHKFELALRKVRGVGQVKTEYYRHGVLKVRVTFEGEGRLAQALRARGVPGYTVRVLGEDQTTLQISVASDNEERRPG